MKKRIIQTLIISILCGFSMAVKAAEIRNIKMLCFERDVFLDTVGESQKLFLIGTMPGLNSLIEVYRGKDLDWSIVVRLPKKNETCVLVSGDQLIDVDYFAEKNL